MAGEDLAGWAGQTTPVWPLWTGSTASATADLAWANWSSLGTTGSVTTASEVWQTWTYETGTGVSSAWYAWVVTPGGASLIEQCTPVEQEMIRHVAEDVARRVDAGRQRAEAAQQKAEQLLREHLTPEQERAWQENRAIFVTGQSGKRYQIKEGHTHNVFEVDEAGRPVREFCVHVGFHVPKADNVLAQKLALQFNEAELLRRANWWDLSQPGRPLVHRGQ